MDAVKHCPPDMTWLLHLRTHGSYGNLHKMEPINIPLQMEEGLMRLHLPEEVLAVDGYWGSECHFLQWCRYW